VVPILVRTSAGDDLVPTTSTAAGKQFLGFAQDEKWVKEGMIPPHQQL
jgi:hypothetical protein